jgi:hypothetical protein
MSLNELDRTRVSEGLAFAIGTEKEYNGCSLFDRIGC